MQINKTVRTLKYPLFYVHTLFVLVVSSIIFIALTIFFIGKNQEITKTHIKEWANIANLSAKQSLLYEDQKTELLNSLLNNFKEISDINFIYIYKKEAQGVSLVYYHNKTPLLTSSFSDSKIQNLHSPVIINNALEYIEPVLSNKNDVIGYIYIQTSSKVTPALLKTLTLFALIVFVIIFFSSLLLISFYYQNIMKHLQRTIETAQAVAKFKNYRTTFERSHFKEIDKLNYSLNIMLTRIDKDIHHCEKSRQEVFNLNSDLENRITSRTEELKKSNNELLSTLEKLHKFQRQLVESEKMAALGDMVAGVAHEINTPIGLGVTASSMLEDSLHDIQQAYNNQTLKGSELKRFLDDSEQSVSIVSRNLNRAAQLISSFKQVAVDQSNEEPRHVNVKQLINEICTTLAPQLSNTNYNITISCDPELEVVIKAGPINQILINLIMNSKIHGFNNGPTGDISITVLSLSNQLNIFYEDNGIGIDEAVKSKIFEPFITTKRSESGTGLGLHLVYNLVTQALGGSIEMINKPNKGVIFEINFPI